MKEFKTVWSKSFKELDFFEKFMLLLAFNLALPVILGLWLLFISGLISILSHCI